MGIKDMVSTLKKSAAAASLTSAPNADKVDPSVIVCKSVKDAGFNPILEYAGDDATYQSDPGKSVTNPNSSASEEVPQPLWTAQVRASLTQIYEKCSVPIPSLLQRPPHLRPLLSAADITASTAINTSGEVSQNSSTTTTTNNMGASDSTQS